MIRTVTTRLDDGSSSRMAACVLDARLLRLVMLAAFGSELCPSSLALLRAGRIDPTDGRWRPDTLAADLKALSAPDEWIPPA